MSNPKRLKCCNVSIRFLRYCLIFPQEAQEDSSKYIICITGIFAAIFFIIALVLLFIFMGVKNHYRADLIQFGIVCIVSLCGVLWINVCFIKNRHIFIALAEALSDFQTFGKPPSYDEFNKKLNFLSKLHLAYVTGGALLYFIVFAPIHKSNCQRIDQQKHLIDICHLLIPIYVPSGDYSQLVKPLLYFINVFEFFMLMYVYVVCGTVVWLNLEMVAHICLRIRHLKQSMLITFRNKNQRERRKMFDRDVQYHEEVLRMGRLADKFFGIELFLHGILTGAILGVSAFSMIDSGTLETLMIFVGWLNAIIMGCVAGQHLINESSTISDILYEVDWYNFETDLKKDIVLFLLRSKKPMYITAGTVVMKNQLIIQTLRTSYSYITFLSSIGK